MNRKKFRAGARRNSPAYIEGCVPLGLASFSFVEEYLKLGGVYTTPFSLKNSAVWYRIRCSFTRIRWNSMQIRSESGNLVSDNLHPVHTAHQERFYRSRTVFRWVWTLPFLLWNRFRRTVSLLVPKRFWNRFHCSVNAVVSRNSS